MKLLKAKYRSCPLGVIVTLCGLVLSSQVQAEFSVCNRSFDVINVAIGQDVDGAFSTSGWWTVGPNQCANVIREELPNRYIYVHAQDVFGQSVVNGSTQMCTATQRFQIRGIDDCWARGHIRSGFIEVDTHKTQRWTLFLSPSP